MLLPELAESFLDLWHHFDGVEAGRTDRFGPAPALVPFNEKTLKLHSAAFRSMAHAVEELELDSIDDEIDRTILIDSIRVRLRRVEHDRPDRRNPALWLDRLATVVASRPDDQAVWDAIPSWVAALQSTVKKPPLGCLEIAIAMLEELRATVTAPAAAEALAGLDGFLRHDLAAEAGPDAGSLGEDQVTWHLHHEFKIEMTAAQAERRLIALVEASAADLEAGRPPAGGGGAAAWASVAVAGREIRRRITAPEWLTAIDLYSGYLSPGERHVALVIAGLDLAIQLGRIGAAEGVAKLTDRLPSRGAQIRRVIVAPLESVGAVLLAADWHALGQARGEVPPELLGLAFQRGTFHPALAAWALGTNG